MKAASPSTAARFDSNLAEKPAASICEDVYSSVADIDGFGALTLHESYDEKSYVTHSTYTTEKQQQQQQQHPSSARTQRRVAQPPHTVSRASPAAKRTFKDRFWSHSSANYSGPDPDDAALPDMTGPKRTPYVPTHAASDFCRTTNGGGARSWEEEERRRRRRAAAAAAASAAASAAATSGGSSTRSGTAVSTPAEPSDYASFMAKAEADARRTGTLPLPAPVLPNEDAKQTPRLRSEKSMAMLRRQVADYIKPAA